MSELPLEALEAVAGGRDRGRNLSPADLACARGVQRTLALTEQTPEGLRLRYPEGHNQALATAEACDQSDLVRALRRADQRARQPSAGDPR